MNTENAVRKVLISGLGEIPEAGGIISGLVEILWPESQADIWDQIKDQVEALINKKLADLEYQQVKEDLEGLQKVLNDYTKALQHSKSNPTFISEKYNVALGQFEVNQKHFMSKGYEVLLLPLLAQMANLHLALLLDGVSSGNSWGWTPRIIEDMKSYLSSSINTYKKWVDKWYKIGLGQVDIPKSGRNLSTRQWAAKNKYVRGMNLQVLDISFYWDCFTPNSKQIPKLTREIYSDPQGTADDNPIKIDKKVKKKITELSIWGWDRIDAVQQAFGGKSLGPRMGDERGGANKPPHGWTGFISETNPLVKASGRSGAIINSMKLIFKDGSKTNLCGGNYDGGDPYKWEFDSQIISQIYITGVSNFYHSADCVIYGFRFDDSY